MSHDPTFWIIARASGLLAYVLVSATVVAGLVLRGRPVAKLRPAAVADIHRFLSLLGLMAVALHGAALVLDSTVEISPVALLVPGLAPYRPLWTGIGVVVFELMLLIHLSFRMRSRIGARNWRRLHWAAYAAFAGATIHGLMSGTDSDRPWALAVYLGVTAVVAGLTAWRATAPRRGRRAGPPVTAPAAGVATRPSGGAAHRAGRP